MAILAAGVRVHAYVLPAPHILDLMVENLGSARALEVSQKNILLDPGVHASPCGPDDENCEEPSTGSREQPDEDAAPAEPVTVPETVRYAFPKSFRSDISAPPTDRIHIYTLGRSVTVVDGAIADEAESPFDYYKHLLLHRSRGAFTTRLAERGVDTSIASLGRFDGRVAYVIGAVYPDPSAPQIWIDKETLRPIRWIVQGAEADEEAARFEIRYLDWRKVSRVWYPDRIEFLRDGTPVRLIQVEDIILDPPASRDLFNIDSLLARSQPSQPPPGSESRTDGLSDIQKALEEFKRLFE
jgi:hypothetical protein